MLTQGQLKLKTIVIGEVRTTKRLNFRGGLKQFLVTKIKIDPFYDLIGVMRRAQEYFADMTSSSFNAKTPIKALENL